MSVRAVRVVFRKETSDNLRDRRSLLAALFYPLLGPVLMLGLLLVMGRSTAERAERALPLPVMGAGYAPLLVRYLEQHGVDVLEAPRDPEVAVRDGDADVVLVIPEGYAAAFSAGEPATVRLVLDSSRQTSDVNIRRARGLLEAYAAEIGALRLMSRGMAPVVVEPLAVETVDIATPQSRAAQLLGILPYFLIFSAFIGGTYLAIDSTAGERERGSMEPLVANPVRRRDLVYGKMTATMVFTVVAVVETVVVFAAILNLVPLERFIGLSTRFDATSAIWVLAVMLPVIPFAVALQFLVATRTRSYKEAQNYLSLLPLVPALPGLFLAFAPVKPQLWLLLVPTLGQQLIISQAVRGEAVDPQAAVASAAATLVAAAAVVALVLRAFESDRIVLA